MKYKVLILTLICGFIGSFQTQQVDAVEFSTYHSKPVSYYTDNMSYKLLDYRILDDPMPKRRKDGDYNNLGKYILIHMQAINDDVYEEQLEINDYDFDMFNGPNTVDAIAMPETIQDPDYENVNSEDEAKKVKVGQGETKKFSLLYVVYPENDLSFLMGGYQDNAKAVSLHKASSKNGITSD